MFLYNLDCTERKVASVFPRNKIRFGVSQQQAKKKHKSTTAVTGVICLSSGRIHTVIDITKYSKNINTPNCHCICDTI